MQYYSCRCANRTVIGSLPPNQCDRCDKCGSGIGYLGCGEWPEPVPHDFSQIVYMQTPVGKVAFMVCIYCHRSRHEVEKLERQTQNT